MSDIGMLRQLSVEALLYNLSLGHRDVHAVFTFPAFVLWTLDVCHSSITPLRAHRTLEGGSAKSRSRYFANQEENSRMRQNKTP